MRVEIWSEVTCPWWGLGGHRLQQVVERFEHGEHVEVAHPLGSGFPEGSAFTVGDALQGRDLAPADLSGFAGRSPSGASGGRSSTTPSRRGAPFIVVDGRYGVAGAQDSDKLPQLLHRACDETHPVALAPSGPDG